MLVGSSGLVPVYNMNVFSVTGLVSSMTTPTPTLPTDVVDVGGQQLFACQFAVDDSCGISLGTQWFLNTGATNSENTGPDRDRTSGNGNEANFKII